MTSDLPAAALQAALFDRTALTAVVTLDGTPGDPTDKAFVVLYDDESKRMFTWWRSREARTLPP
jgi:hypothetical protein